MEMCGRLDTSARSIDRSRALDSLHRRQHPQISTQRELSFGTIDLARMLFSGRSCLRPIRVIEVLASKQSFNCHVLEGPLWPKRGRRSPRRFIEIEILSPANCGKSDKPRGRRRDPRGLRSQNPAAQSSRHEGTRASEGEVRTTGVPFRTTDAEA